VRPSEQRGSWTRERSRGTELDCGLGWASGPTPKHSGRSWKVYVIEVRHRREGVDDAQERRRGVGEEAVWGGGVELHVSMVELILPPSPFSTQVQWEMEFLRRASPRSSRGGACGR
jgi:hypothetical protein